VDIEEFLFCQIGRAESGREGWHALDESLARWDGVSKEIELRLRPKPFTDTAELVAEDLCSCSEADVVLENNLGNRAELFGALLETLAGERAAMSLGEGLGEQFESELVIGGPAKAFRVLR
jgi:hypothetical protein